MTPYGKMKVHSLTFITSAITGANVIFMSRPLHPLTSAYTEVGWMSQPVWTLKKRDESSVLPEMDRRFSGRPQCMNEQETEDG
jgi:hypothetical protein